MLFSLFKEQKCVTTPLITENQIFAQQDELIISVKKYEKGEIRSHYNVFILYQSCKEHLRDNISMNKEKNIKLLFTKIKLQYFIQIVLYRPNTIRNYIRMKVTCEWHFPLF
jgi:hypothetical protein